MTFDRYRLAGKYRQIYNRDNDDRKRANEDEKEENGEIRGCIVERR